MQGVSSAVSDDVYATARVKALRLPIRFILKLISPPPVDSPRLLLNWLLRQCATAAGLGPPAAKIGLAATAIWLAAWAIYPQTLLIYAASYIRRKALGAPAPPVYIPATVVAYIYTLAATALAFLTRVVEWRGRKTKLTTTPTKT